MVIAVIDGMGGSIGAEIVSRLSARFSQKITIMVLGTNSIATSKMMKAGANCGASGENAIIVSIQKADVIIGSLSIIIPNSWMGELTPAIAEAVSGASGKKVFLPLTNPPLDILGMSKDPLPHLMDEALEKIEKFISEEEV